MTAKIVKKIIEWSKNTNNVQYFVRNGTTLKNICYICNPNKTSIMNHKEFLSEVQKSCHEDYPHCTALLSALLKLMAKAAVEQIPVTIPGLGTFVSHKHPEYIQDNEETGEQVLYPPRISYRMSCESKGAVSVAEDLAESSHQSLEFCQEFLSAMAAIINGALQNREEVNVHGLGNFHLIEAHQSELHRIAFTPDEVMREQANAPFNCFEPVVISRAEAPAAVTEGTINETEETVAEEVAEETEEPVEETEKTVSLQEEPVSEKEKSVIEAVESVTARTAIIEETTAVEEEVQAEEALVDETVATTGIATAADVVAPVEDVQINDEVAIEEQTPMDNASVVDKQQESQSTQTKETEKVPSTDDETLDEEFEDESSSSNKLLYTSLSVILVACVILGIFILSLTDTDYETAPLTVKEPVRVTKTVTEPDSALTKDTLLETGAEQQKAIVQEPVEHIGVEPNTVESKPEVQKIVESKPAEQKTVESKPVEQKTVETKTMHRLMGADGQPVTVTLQQGERLTIVALNHFGDKTFWPYIFDVNADKIKAPNLVQAGMKLYLPDPAYYDIDAQSEESLRKAKNRAAQLLK